MTYRIRTVESTAVVDHPFEVSAENILRSERRTIRLQRIFHWRPAIVWRVSYLGLVERIGLAEPFLNHCQINRILDYIQIVRNLNQNESLAHPTEQHQHTNGLSIEHKRKQSPTILPTRV